jgi:hypothetical protein
MVEFNIYLMFKLYKLFFNLIRSYIFVSDNGNSLVPSPNSNFMKKRILIALYLLYILIINHTFIIANRVTVLK